MDHVVAGFCSRGEGGVERGARGGGENENSGQPSFEFLFLFFSLMECLILWYCILFYSRIIPEKH